MEVVEELGKLAKTQMSLYKAKYGLDVKCTIKVKSKLVVMKIPNLALIKATEPNFSKEVGIAQLKVNVIDDSYKVKFVEQ